MGLPERKGRSIPGQDIVQPGQNTTPEVNQALGKISCAVEDAMSRNAVNKWAPEARDALKTSLVELFARIHGAAHGSWSNVRTVIEEIEIPDSGDGFRRFNELQIIIDGEYSESLQNPDLLTNYQDISRLSATNGTRKSFLSALELLQHNVATAAELQEKQRRRGRWGQPGAPKRTRSIIDPSTYQ